MKETRKISELKNWDKNPRSIKEKDFKRLKKQIQELGQYKPLIITDDGTVLGGNMRLRAYKELGIEDIWVSVVEAPTEAHKLKFALSDNDRAGFYDSDLLANLIPEYPEFEWADYAVDLKEPQSLQDLIDSLTPVDKDEAPPLSDAPAVSKLGEIYQLGKHRLMCGDATKIEDVEKLMDGQKADMVFTDPPWNVAIGEDSNPRHRQREGLMNDNLGIDFFKFLADSAVSIATFCDGDIYCVMGCEEWPNIHKALTEAGLHWSSTIVWVKDQFVLGRSKYHRRYEPIWYGWRDKSTFVANRSQDDVWEIVRPKVSEDHPTMKPIELCARAIKNSSITDGIVLDLFGGSGSTLIACEQTNRTCYMMELDPKYCDVIRKRYENFIKNKQ